MKVITHSSYDEMSKQVAKIIQTLLKEKPEAIICLPTGSTPIKLYEHLVQMYKNGEIDFSKATFFNLDEYIGLDSNHPQSYAYFLKEHLYNHINVQQENLHFLQVPREELEYAEKYCHAYEEKITVVNGFDLLIDGIGLNGHLGFNEPAEELHRYTHIEKLAPSTIEANARFFERKEDVPTYAVTVGIETMFQAKRHILMANGAHKAEIVREIVDANITPNLPASLLHLHPNCEMHVDQEAGQLL